MNHEDDIIAYPMSVLEARLKKAKADFNHYNDVFEKSKSIYARQKAALANSKVKAIEFAIKIKMKNRSKLK